MYDDELASKQCGFCAYYIPLRGKLAEDWGLCSCESSIFDRMAVFEHDGCDHHVPAPE